MARLTDGGFVIVWADKRQNERIRAQRFGFEGAKNGSEFRANTVPGLHRVPMVACLVNGNIVIGWRARLPGPLLVHLQIFDANGPVGGEQTTGLDITEAAMTALNSGRFVIAHVRSAFDGEPGFETTIAQASVFEASGRFLQHPVSCHCRAADPVLLADARAAAGWPFSAGVDATQRRQRGRRHRRQGQNFFSSRSGRSGHPVQHLDGQPAIQPGWLDNHRPRG